MLGGYITSERDQTLDFSYFKIEREGTTTLLEDVEFGEELFEDLDAPVRRLGALDTFVGYNPALEEAILPQVADLTAAIRDLAAY